MGALSGARVERDPSASAPSATERTATSWFLEDSDQCECVDDDFAAATTIISAPIAPVIASRVAVVALERLGWSLLAGDIDLSSGALRVELRRTDGLTVTLDRDALGRASLTRERAVHYMVTVGRRGVSCPVDRIRHEFIGRVRIHGGPRDALRSLANYVGDNAVATNRHLGRAAVALLMERQLP